MCFTASPVHKHGTMLTSRSLFRSCDASMGEEEPFLESVFVRELGFKGFLRVHRTTERAFDEGMSFLKDEFHEA